MSDTSDHPAQATPPNMAAHSNHTSQPGHAVQHGQATHSAQTPYPGLAESCVRPSQRNNIGAEITLTPEALRTIAVTAAHTVGEPLKSAFRSGMHVETKSSPHDLVTIFDAQTEEVLTRLLFDAAPDSRITGEESGSRGAGPLEWIVDPIDGTSNFAHGFAMFSISIAAVIDGEVVAGVVHDPVNELTFSADNAAAYLQTADSNERILTPESRPRPERDLNLMSSFPSPELLYRERDLALESFAELVTTYTSVRRVISGALELCHAAAGWADVVVGTDTKPWDVAAAMLILRRSGGHYLPFGERKGKWSGSWDGVPSASDHLAPHYLGLVVGVSAPTAERVLRSLPSPPA